ncbi:hypothetical protein P8452_13459 [Trifolium repens]|nr:hypothetical protein P8452_13459 [Trifolium repens]
MLLLDNKGCTIQASIPWDLLSKFDYDVNEGKIYKMSHLYATPNIGGLRPSFHRFRLVFNVDTRVEHSEGLSGSVDNFAYIVDVIGVVTYVRHYRNYFDDGRVTQTVTIELSDLSYSYQCELSGGLVDEFRSSVRSCSTGLPVIVLKYVKIDRFQVIHGIDGLTRLYVNPVISNALSYRFGLVSHMDKVRPSAGLNVSVGVGHCGVSSFLVAPKARLTIEVEDQTDYAVFDGYDHVMLGLDSVGSIEKEIGVNVLYNVFTGVIGKSLMFIVEKKSNNVSFVGASIEMVRVSDNASVIKYFTDIGCYNTPSKIGNIRPRFSVDGGVSGKIKKLGSRGNEWDTGCSMLRHNGDDMAEVSYGTCSMMVGLDRNVG